MKTIEDALKIIKEEIPTFNGWGINTTHHSSGKSRCEANIYGHYKEHGSQLLSKAYIEREDGSGIEYDTLIKTMEGI